MDNIEYTAKLMETYALKLAKAIEESGSNIVIAKDYFYIVDNLLSALAEFSSTFDPVHYNEEDKKRFINQLLHQIRVGVLNKVKEFKDLNLELDKLIII